MEDVKYKIDQIILSYELYVKTYISQITLNYNFIYFFSFKIWFINFYDAELNQLKEKK
jgi:hypothetical protein